MSERTGLHRPGQTFFGGAPTNATDGDSILGREVIIKDRIRGYERIRTLRAVRNSYTAALLPKRSVQISADGRTATGYTRLPSDNNTGLVDEQLAAAGVVANDIFWVVIKGLGLSLTPLSDLSADIAAGDLMNCITAATSGATTAGRLKQRTLVAATTDATATQRNVTENDGTRFRAVSTALTNSTNNDLLVDVNPW